jgi:hypothetical protein
MCKRVLAHCPEVGLIAGWAPTASPGGGLQAPACPAFPYQWLNNAAALPLVMRAEALEEACGLASGRTEPAAWELVNTVLANGWVGVTVPAIGATWAMPRRTRPASPASFSARLADFRQRDAEAIALLSSGSPIAVLHPDTGSWAARLDRLREHARQPYPLFRLLPWLGRRLALSAIWAPLLWLSTLRTRAAGCAQVEQRGQSFALAQRSEASEKVITRRGNA